MAWRNGEVARPALCAALFTGISERITRSVVVCSQEELELEILALSISTNHSVVFCCAFKALNQERIRRSKPSECRYRVRLWIGSGSGKVARKSASKQKSVGATGQTICAKEGENKRSTGVAAAASFKVSNSQTVRVERVQKIESRCSSDEIVFRLRRSKTNGTVHLLLSFLHNRATGGKSENETREGKETRRFEFDS